MATREECAQQNPERRRVCLACDNRHGCLTPEPHCLRLERVTDERALGGQELMARRGLLDQCRACGLFRRCWDPDSYQRRLASGEK